MPQADETWPIPWLQHDRTTGERRESLLFDRQTAQDPTMVCGVCKEGPLRFDYHYVKTPYVYRAFTICPNHHIEEF
jgi:uncharacterized CHY-type Zn-finger protein